MSETVLIPGARDVRGVVDAADATSCVIACPPHPQMGGTRSDRRLTAVADALAPDVATLRFDYGSWDRGLGELADARNAFTWARAQYDPVGLFGYSFGGGIALLTAARESEDDSSPAGIAVLAPTAEPGSDLNAAAAVREITCPGYVLAGKRDTTAVWEPVVKHARERGWRVELLSGDHHFVGQMAAVGERCGGFLRDMVGH